MHRKPHQLRSLNGDSLSRGGLLPLPLRERIEVRGVVNFNCMVTAERQQRFTVDFPVTTVKTTFTLASVITSRANTLLDVSPPVDDPCVPHPFYPIYQPDHFKSAKAPLVKNHSLRSAVPRHMMTGKAIAARKPRPGLPPHSEEHTARNFGD